MTKQSVKNAVLQKNVPTYAPSERSRGLVNDSNFNTTDPLVVRRHVTLLEKLTGNQIDVTDQLYPAELGSAELPVQYAQLLECFASLVTVRVKKLALIESATAFPCVRKLGKSCRTSIAPASALAPIWVRTPPSAGSSLSAAPVPIGLSFG